MAEQDTTSSAPTRTAVLLVHAESYRRRSGVSHEQWCERVDGEYCRLVPARHRTLAAPDLARIDDADEWIRRRRAWDQQVRRLTAGDVRFPADLEEPWVAALPEPWRTRCKQELARRHGLWGAVRHPEGGAGDHACWGSALTEMGGLTQRMGEVLADGQITEEDRAELPDVIERARAMQAALASLEQRALAALNGEDSGEASPGNVSAMTREARHG